LLGLRTALANIGLGDGLTLTPRLGLGWQHALAKLTPSQTVSYVNTSTSFLVQGTPLAQDAASVEAGLALKLAPSASLCLSYDGSFSATTQNHAIRMGLNWRF
jgi:fibronectin-binding autotransporter adhesin